METAEDLAPSGAEASNDEMEDQAAKGSAPRGAEASPSPQGDLLDRSPAPECILRDG